MANQTLTSSIIAKESLMVLENQLTMAKGVNREYSNKFANEGAKIGATYNLRKPPRYMGREGAALQVENSVENYVPVTLDTQAGCDISFTSADLTLNIDEFRERFIVPAMATVANKVDFALTGLYKDVFRIVNAGASAAGYGTAGTLSGGSATLAQVQGMALSAGAILTESGVPNAQRAAIVDPASRVGIISPFTSNVFDNRVVSDIFDKTAFASKTFGFDWAEDANVQQFTPMAAGSVTALSSAPAAGATTLAVTTTAGTVPKGTILSVAGVFAINPQTRQSTGRLMQFVVTADTAVTTSGTLPIYPAYIPSGQFATCVGTPGGTAAITIHTGAVGAGPYSQNLAFHKDAFALVSADLELPGGVHFAARENYKGISMRLVRQYDINSDQIPCRLDVLFGVKTIYPELAVRLGG